MSLIEGVGDEVVHFFIGFFIFMIIIAAWWTTNIRRDYWQIRTVYLIDRRFRRRNHRSLTNHTQSATISESTLPSSDTENDNITNRPETENAENTDPNKPPEPSTSAQPDRVEEIGSRSLHEQEQMDIVQTMDADTTAISPNIGLETINTETNVLRQRRVAFYENRRETLIESSTSDPQISANISDNTDHDSSRQNEHNQNNVQENNQSNAQDSIRIKLKYINDDLKLVDGRLEELLGDFKRRHFSNELSSNKLVRLIFNGQVLQRDSDTLQSCGLFDNCVVHCLVHQQRSLQNEDSDNRNNEQSSRNSFGGRTSYTNNNNNNNNREWDLSNVLIAMVSFSLGSAWYFRYQYPHLFTVTATVALVAVTGIFTVVSVGMYFPDPEPTQPPMENVL